jgi:hypothetical protein
MIFRSSDPAVWNTDSPDEKRFAIPLARVPQDTQFLKMSIDPDRFVIIAMTKDKLGTVSNQGRFGWEGRNAVVRGGHQLGVFDRTAPKTWTKGDVCIFYENGGRSGWGFGYRGILNDQGFAWEGKFVGSTVCEIYVTSNSLSPQEEQHLLKQPLPTFTAPSDEGRPSPEQKTHAAHHKHVGLKETKVIYTFKNRDAVLENFDMEGDWDVASGELVLMGRPRPKGKGKGKKAVFSSGKSKAVFCFPVSIEYQMYFLPDRPYDLFPGFAGVHLRYATNANTRTEVQIGDKSSGLPHVKAMPKHVYSMILAVDRDRTLVIRIDGREIIRQHLDDNVSLTGPVFLGPLLGHVACKKIIVRTDPPSAAAEKTSQ